MWTADAPAHDDDDAICICDAYRNPPGQCPIHAKPQPRTAYCPTCRRLHAVTDEHLEQVGWEEQGLEVNVLDLACGHQLETRTHPRLRRPAGGRQVPQDTWR